MASPDTLHVASVRLAAIAKAADLLWDCWQHGRRVPSIPEDVRPRTREEGYAVQALIQGRSAAPLFGWKIAATSAAGQAHINVTGPLAGRLLQERVIDLSRASEDVAWLPASAGRGRFAVELPFGVNHMKVAEAEFAFRMGRDLSPRDEPYSVDEVLAAVATLHAAIEIPDSRFDDFTIVGAPQLIADNACAHLFVLGSPTDADWRAIDLAAHRVTGSVVPAAPLLGPSSTGNRNEILTCEGNGANVLGDPRIALAWLANELSGLGVTLRAGEVVTTGTCLTPLPIGPGVDVIANFGVLGDVRARVI